MTEHDITLTVNGTDHELTVESRTLLVHALRDALGYTGTNVGCESSLCGACTVHLDGDAVKSCTVFAVQADGAEVETVEGLADADGTFHPIQSAFQAEHGLQCGYCTPGMMLTATAFEGNICRCTGYQNIVNAVETAAADLRAATDGGRPDGR